MSSPELGNILCEHEKFVFSILEENILLIFYKDKCIIEEDDVLIIEKAYNDLPYAKPMKVITQYGKFVSISSDARNKAAERSPDLIAIAYVINSLSQRLLLKFYIKIVKRKKPTKVFQSIEEALEWLKPI